jgi:hypothetical protein
MRLGTGVNNPPPACRAVMVIKQLLPTSWKREWGKSTGAVSDASGCCFAHNPGKRIRTVQVFLCESP